MASTNGRDVSEDLKRQIINDIRNNGLSVAKAAEKIGVTNRTVYNWLRSSVVGSERNLVLENKRLKKENEQLHNLLGRATAEMKRPKS